MHDTSVNGRKPGWLAFLLLVPILIAAAVVGFFVFVIILGLALLAVAGLLLRLWWLRRKLRRTGSSQVLEGEYTVVRERTPRDGRSGR